MKSDINPEILDKIKKNSSSTNVKEFLFEVLEFEYNHINESQPRFKDNYVKYVEKWKK